MPVFPQPVYYFTSQSANYQAQNGDCVLASTGTGGITVTLPPSPPHGAIVMVRKVDAAAGSFTVKTSDGSAIDTVAGSTGIVSATSQHAGYTFSFDGASWWIVGS